MPRVITKTKNRAGKARACGRCGAPIEPGERYRQWSFRYGGTHYRCHRPTCNPRPSELTQSLLSEVYAAREEAEAELPRCETYADMRALLEQVAEAAREVAQQYEEAAEAFGGEGENAERAYELEEYADGLEAIDLPDDDDLHPDDQPDREDLLAECESALDELML